MTTDKYNGWTNYETWNVALWLDNEPGTYEDARRIIRIEPDDWQAGKNLREYVESLPEIEGTLSSASMAADLLGAALSEVSWDEIVGHYREDENEDEDD